MRSQIWARPAADTDMLVFLPTLEEGQKMRDLVFTNII
jgi:hypothetical protein